MKKHLLLLCLLLSSSMLFAQKADYSKLIKNSWTLEAVHGLDSSDASIRRVNKELKDVRLEFLDQNRVMLMVKNQLVMINYDISKSSKATYLNLSGFVMLYAKINSITSSTMTLDLDFPQKDGKNIQMEFSKSSFKLLDSFEQNVQGGYVLTDYYRNRYMYDDAKELTEKEYIRLLDSHQMICLFNGTKDSGTWALNTKKMQLDLKGSAKTYSFQIDRFFGSYILLKSLSGTEQKSYSFTKAPFFNFDDEEPDYSTTEIETYNDEPDVVVEAEEAAAAEEAPVEAETDAQVLCKSWKAYTFESENSESSSVDSRIILYPDGSVYYSEGKKKKKGTWSIDETRRTLMFKWGKKEEVAAYTFGYYYTSGYDTQTSLYLTFTPPTGKKVITVQFRQESAE